MIYHKIDTETGLLNLNEPDVILDAIPLATEEVTVNITDEDGNVTGQDTVNQPLLDEDGNTYPDPSYIDGDIPSGLYHAKMDFETGEWVEGLTEEEIAEINTESPEDEIKRLKQSLTDTDYAVIKIAEGAATAEEYADVITQRQTWRSRINELEATNFMWSLGELVTLCEELSKEGDANG